MQSPAERPPRKPASLRSRLLLLAAGLSLGVMAAECFLAVSGIVALSPYEQDRVCGARLKANYAGWQTQEGKVFVRTNSDGFRDREHAHEKPANTIRIAVLGDSYCEAAQVELEQTFWSVMERSLNQCLPAGSRTVEVINAGVSGYGTTQELLMLRHRLWDYEPDLILLGLLAGNDIRNNSKSLEPDQNRPFYRLDGGQLELDAAFLDNPLFASSWVRLKDQLVSRTRLGALAYRLRHRESAAAEQREGEAGLDNFIYQPPKSDAQQEAWRITELLLREIYHEAQQHEATLVVASIPSGIQVHPDASKRQAFAARLGSDDLDYADRRIGAYADELGCQVILLAEPMRHYAESHGRFLHGFENTKLGVGHWNAEGHRVAGEIIAQTLCDSRSLLDLATQ